MAQRPTVPTSRATSIGSALPSPRTSLTSAAARGRRHRSPAGVCPPLRFGLRGCRAGQGGVGGARVLQLASVHVPHHLRGPAVHCFFHRFRDSLTVDSSRWQISPWATGTSLLTPLTASTARRATCTCQLQWFFLPRHLRRPRVAPIVLHIREARRRRDAHHVNRLDIAYTNIPQFGVLCVPLLL